MATEFTTTLNPTGDGDLTEIPVPAGPPHWDRILSTDLVLLEQPANTSGKRDLYTIPTSGIPASATITGVGYCYRFKSDAGGGGFCGAYALTKISGVVRVHGGPDFTPTTAWDDYEWVSLSDGVAPCPPGGWTVSIINSMQVGTRLNSSGLSGRGYLDKFFIKVYWTITMSVQTDPATNISSSGATLNGTLTDDGSDTPVYCSFQWGLTPAYGTETLAEAVAESATFSKVIGNNLIAGTTYHFRAKAVGASGATVYGADRTFVTGGGDDLLIRVQGIVHRFAAGENGQPGVYEMELQLGGLSSQFIPPLQSKKAMPTIETEEMTAQNTGTQMTQREALYQYIIWKNKHTSAQVRAIFGTPSVDFQKWWAWYKVYGTGAF